MSYFYGPVPSRRLGFSLGVDLIPKKTCSFNCIYCQLGYSNKKTIQRTFYVNLATFRKELKEIIKNTSQIDYITISGSGEPTLHKNLDIIITTIKKVTQNKYPICVITNSSLLYRKDVRRELRGADLIIPSLDAFTSQKFHKINQPHKKIVLKKIIDGLIQLRKEFKGEIWLEVMVLRGVNDTLEDAKKLKEIIKKIKPDRVQLNIPIRPPATRILLPSRQSLRKIKKVIDANVEVVSSFQQFTKRSKTPQYLKDKILNLLRVRPASLEDLTKILPVSSQKILKQLRLLHREGYIEERQYKKIKYFVIK